MSLNIQKIFQVYGPGESESRLWPSVCNAASKGEGFPMANGDQIRNFIDVQEVAKKLFLECKRIYYQQQPMILTVNLGSGKPQKFYNYCHQIWNDTETRSRLLCGVLTYR